MDLIGVLSFEMSDTSHVLLHFPFFDTWPNTHKADDIIVSLRSTVINTGKHSLACKDVKSIKMVNMINIIPAIHQDLLWSL